MPRYPLVLLFTFLSAGACQSTASSGDAVTDTAGIAVAARQVVDSAFAAIVRVDAEGLMRHFIAGDEATFSADGVIIAGHDSIASFFETALAGWAAVDSASLEDVRVAVLGPYAAVVTTYYRERVTDRTGAQFWNEGAWTSALTLRAGRWQIVDSHASHPRTAQ